MGPADASGLGQIAGRRHINTPFSLYRLDQECGGMTGDRGLERGRIAKRDELEPGREWTKSVAILRNRREAYNRNCATMEIAVCYNDFRAIMRHALDLIGPLPNRL